MLQVFFNGIVVSCIFILGAIGLSLTYGILNFANFSHGDIMTLGAYLTFLFKVQFKLPFLLSALLAIVLTSIICIFFDRIFYQRLRRKQGPIILLISSIGVALIIRNLIRLIWGAQPRYYSKKIQKAIKLWGLVRIKPNHIIIIITAIILVLFVHLFLQKTKIGKAMRATSDNLDLANVVGIDSNKIIIWTWILGISLATIGGILLGLDVQLRPTMGWHLLLSIFAATILGGIGNPYGAMLGGLIIGLSEELSTLFIACAYKPMISFTIMIIVLLIKPSGIIGKEIRWD